uniref:Transposon Ty3-I Gag-Pol polyprotein n=1 Tax=Cajanus cajan TaxID=3821 RepID=A0A151TZK1_CAJCA|nr:Transposon Ty3-I Gag-Pol polyprotein [Cajanus cajan]
MRFFQHSISPYANPIILVKKKDFSRRFCMDYQDLNSCLVFFDDILIYSLNLKCHMDYVKEMLDALHDHSLTVDKKKCSFNQESLEYLGHIISSQEVAADPKKVESMWLWLVPKDVKCL